MDHNNDLFIRSTFRSYLFPSICALLGTTITGLIESIIVGNFIGADALAAVNIAKPIYFTFATVGALVSVGAATSASVCIGKEDTEGYETFSSLSLILSVVLGIIVSVLGLLFLPSILYALGARGDLYPLVHDYAFYMMAGGVTIVLMYYPFNFLRVVGKPNKGVIMFAVMAIMNLTLDLLFLKVFEWGLGGMALAAVISTGVADILGFLFLRFPENHFSLRLPKSWKEPTQAIVVTGSSMALNNVCNIFRTMVMNQILLTSFGSVSVTAFAMTATVANFLVAIISGVSQTISPLIGVFYGEEDITSMRQILKAAYRYGMTIILIISILLFFGAGSVCRIFGLDEGAVFEVAKISLQLYVISLLPAMFNNIYIFLFFTTEKNMLANVMTFTRAFLFVVLTAGVCAKMGASNLVWLSFLVAELLTMLVLALWTEMVRRKKPNLSRLSLLNNEIEEDGHYLSFSVMNDVNEAMEASKKMEEFCKQQKFPSNLSMMISLSLEEMLMIIFNHCFKEGQKQSVDIRIFTMENQVVLRMRNGGNIFDPIAYYKKRMAEADKDELLMDDVLGIRMIIKQADTVLFQRTFGVNNLTIKLRPKKEKKEVLHGATQ